MHRNEYLFLLHLPFCSFSCWLLFLGVCSSVTAFIQKREREEKEKEKEKQRQRERERDGEAMSIVNLGLRRFGALPLYSRVSLGARAAYSTSSASSSSSEEDLGGAAGLRSSVGRSERGSTTPRFYKMATAEEDDVHAGQWCVKLDGRKLKTPTLKVLLLPTAALAHAIAAEWQYQSSSSIR